jgi:hypothetical protein
VTENPYAPPRANCVPEPQSDLLQELRSQSTWRLLGLGIITVGTYYAHYCARQSRIINQHSESDLIPEALTILLFALSYISLGLFFGYFLVDDGHPVAIASTVSDKLWMLVVVVWGFYARGAVNKLASFTEDDPRRISGLWTFLFSPLHFNYKINVINQVPVGTQAVA